MMHPVEVAEAATALKVKEFLAKAPPNRRHKVSDHMWTPNSCICVVCGISLLQFHNVPYGNGLPCK